MAQLSAAIQTHTNGQPVNAKQQFRLGEDQADAELRSRSGTTVMVSLMADGSGFLNLLRGGRRYRLLWTEDTPETPGAIELHADFDGLRGTLQPTLEVSDARD